MRINKENYEIYFLDYFENRLTPEAVAELMVFLEQNPDLKAEFESFELVELECDQTATARSFSHLKKPEYIKVGDTDAWNYEDKMAAYLEGDLDESEKAGLQQFIAANPKARLELNLFRKSVLLPDNVVYPDKEELKKGGVVLLMHRPVLFAVSAAAAIVILFGLFTLLRQSQQVDQPARLTQIEMPVKGQQQVPVATPVPHEVTQRDQFHATVLPDDTEAPKELETNKPVQTLRIIKPVHVDASRSYEWASVETTNLNSGMDLTTFEWDLQENKKPSFVARFISGFARKIIGDPNPDKKSLLELSVDGYNLIADRDVEVQKELDAKGNVVAYNVHGETIAFKHRLNKSTVE